MKIKITTDSASDISQDLCEKYNISVVPLYIIIDGVSYKDREEISVAQLFEAMNNTAAVFPSTSAVSEHDFTEFFSSLSDGETEIIHISISSLSSASYNNAIAAAKNFKNVHVIDSKSVSSGIMILAISAAEMIETGMNADQICAKLNSLIAQTDMSLVLDSLKAVRKGGRVSALQAFGAELFQFKPMISMQDGRFIVGKKYRGKLEKALTDYVVSWLKGRTDIDLSRIILTHSFTDCSLLENLKKLVADLQPFEEIIVQNAGCTISCHSGPDAFGMIFYKK